MVTTPHIETLNTLQAHMSMTLPGRGKPSFDDKEVECVGRLFEAVEIESSIRQLPIRSTRTPNEVGGGVPLGTRSHVSITARVEKANFSIGKTFKVLKECFSSANESNHTDNGQVRSQLHVTSRVAEESIVEDKQPPDDIYSAWFTYHSLNGNMDRLSAHYHLARKLGERGQGRAELWVNKTTGTRIVAKVASWKYMDNLLKGSKNIVNFHAYEPCMPTGAECRLVLGFCDIGDLTNMKHQYNIQYTAVPEVVIWKVLIDCAKALKWMSKFDIVHRDIKPCNILLESVPGLDLPTIKPADFGMASFVRGFLTEDDLHFDVGSYDYQPPERPVATAAGDVWALGATAHFLALNEPPVNARSAKKVFDGDAKKWKNSLVRAVISINLPPDQRRTQWKRDYTNAETSWIGTYSDGLQA